MGWKNSIVIKKKMSLSLRCTLKHLVVKWYVLYNMLWNDLAKGGSAGTKCDKC